MQSDDKSRAAETLEDSEAALVAAGDPEVDHALRSTVKRLSEVGTDHSSRSRTSSRLQRA